MTVTSRQLSVLYRNSHDQMRNTDGLQPQEAFDELLKYLFLKESSDDANYAFPRCVPPILHQEITSFNGPLVDNLRDQFRLFLDRTNSWSSELWQDKAFNLSDSALLGVHELFEDIDFSTLDIDTRSAALNEFMPGELRKGLGIFPTPDAVARMMVDVVSPPASSRVFDPACGTGTFLVEVVRHWRGKSSPSISHSVWGADKSARMLLLSELNLGHSEGVAYGRALADSLYQSPSVLFEDFSEGVDYIFTNPPFGIVIDRNWHDMTPFQTCKGPDGSIVKRQQSEVVFVEQCMKYLKPGGLLGIILPRSVVTNSSLGPARQALNTFGYVQAIVNLPPETFSVSGAQTNTVVLFLRRYQSSTEQGESVAIACADIDNVGFDSTGRLRPGSQLESVSPALKSAMNGEGFGNQVRLFPKVAKGHSITNLPELLSGRIVASGQNDTMPLADLVEIATNGKTPGRRNYSSNGLFLVKVGNLTGRGIDWAPRDRNFISGAEHTKRKGSTRLMLRQNDILLTSSAHSPVYIAKKVDLVNTIPKWVGSEASFVGEVMMLRPRATTDSATLIAYLRLPTTQQQVQAMIRGQTAHLHPRDLLELRVPKALLNSGPMLQYLADRVRAEAQLSVRINELAFEQRTVLKAAELELSR